MPSPAAAVTPDELVALTRAGLGDEVLVALVRTTGTNARIDAGLVEHLKRQGVSERVIVALIEAGAPGAPGPPPSGDAAAMTASAAPDDAGLTWENNTAVIGAAPAAAVVEQRVLVVPWVSTGWPGRRPRGKAEPYLPGYRGFGRFINDGFIDGRRPHP
jgi:hypothetical protein